MIIKITVLFYHVKEIGFASIFKIPISGFSTYLLLPPLAAPGISYPPIRKSDTPAERVA
jgi:hypothetical protein